MKTTVELPDALYEEARDLARRKGWTVKVVLEQSLRSYLKREAEAASSGPFKLRRVVAGGEGLQAPGMTFEEMLALAQRSGPPQ